MLIKMRGIEIGTDVRGWYLMATFGRWRVERFYCLDRERFVWARFDAEKEREAHLEAITA